MSLIIFCGFLFTNNYTTCVYFIFLVCFYSINIFLSIFNEELKRSTCDCIHSIWRSAIVSEFTLVGRYIPSPISKAWMRAGICSPVVEVSAAAVLVRRCRPTDRRLRRVMITPNRTSKSYRPYCDREGNRLI